VRFEPRTHRLRGWIIDFPSQVPRRLLDYPELLNLTKHLYAHSYTYALAHAPAGGRLATSFQA